jgi:hypothetical protein
VGKIESFILLKTLLAQVLMQLVEQLLMVVMGTFTTYLLVVELLRLIAHQQPLIVLII